MIQQYQEYIQRQQKVNEALIRLSRQHAIALVATNDVHYLNQSDWHPHEILMNIQSGEPCEIWEKDPYGNPKFRLPNPKRETYPSHAFDFKSAEQMQRIFSDLPEALEQTIKIAQQCHVEFDFKTKHYPVYLPPSLHGRSYTEKEHSDEVEKFLRQLCEEGISKRYTPERLAKVQEIYVGKDPMQVIHERLDYELNVIITKGMSDY